MANIYIKSSIPHSQIKTILNKYNLNKIIFYIDLQSIAKGLYQKNNVFTEINYFINNQKPSDILINEYRTYLNKLYNIYRPYSPFFVTFFDDGINEQNTAISSAYKQGRSTFSHFLKDDESELFKKIKTNYFIELEKLLNKDSLKILNQVYYLKQLEADFIPHYVIMNNLFDSTKIGTLNIIISNDKDLLQTCKFKNTMQVTNRFFPSQSGKKQMAIELFDTHTAIQYIYKKFKIGQLTSEYIPLLLSLMGDKADGIFGLKGIGAAKGINLISNYNLPYDIVDLQHYDNLPKIIEDNIDLIIQNYKMTSFEEQLRRSKNYLK